MQPILLTLFNRICRHRLFVDADPSDNTLTLSPLLLRFITRIDRLGENRVFVFRLSSHGEYAFTLNPTLPSESVTAPIQLNVKLQCAGFASYCPSVNRIAYDYHLPHSSTHRLPVTVHRLPDHRFIYILNQPFITPK